MESVRQPDTWLRFTGAMQPCLSSKQAAITGRQWDAVAAHAWGREQGGCQDSHEPQSPDGELYAGHQYALPLGHNMAVLFFPSVVASSLIPRTALRSSSLLLSFLWSYSSIFKEFMSKHFFFFNGFYVNVQTVGNSDTQTHVTAFSLMRNWLVQSQSVLRPGGGMAVSSNKRGIKKPAFSSEFSNWKKNKTVHLEKM